MPQCMATHNDLGIKGENIAKEFLIKEGFRILETNWRYGKDEVDVIAIDQQQLVFVEVKTRSNNYFGDPEMAITKSKQRFLIRAAQAYIFKKNNHLEARFDVVSIITNADKTEVNLIKNAFYPTYNNS